MRLKVVRDRVRQYEDLDTGERFFSVSEVLSVLDPDAYKYVHPDVLAAAADRGTFLHLLFGHILLSRIGLLPRPNRPDGLLAGYFDAMCAWVETNKVEPMRVEESAIWSGKKVAGTPDTLCLYGPYRTPTLVDLKSTSVPHRTHRVQITVYRRLEGYQAAKALRVLYIRPDGTYEDPEVKPNPGYEAWFLNGLNVLIGREQL